MQSLQIDSVQDLITPTNVELVITSGLNLGSRDTETNGEVSRLQEFLIDQGVYPEKIVSGYYGNLTKKAVDRLLKKEGITSGLNEGFSQRIFNILNGNKEVLTDKKTEKIESSFKFEDIIEKQDSVLGNHRSVDSIFTSTLDFRETKEGNYQLSTSVASDVRMNLLTSQSDAEVVETTKYILDGEVSEHKNTSFVRKNDIGTFVLLDKFDTKTFSIDQIQISANKINTRIKDKWFKLSSRVDKNKGIGKENLGSYEFISIWLGGEDYYDAFTIKESSRSFDNLLSQKEGKNLYRYDVDVDTDLFVDILQKKKRSSDEQELLDQYGFSEMKDFRQNINFKTYNVWLDQDGELFALGYMMELENIDLEGGVEKLTLEAYVDYESIEPIVVKVPEEFSRTTRNTLLEVIESWSSNR